MIPQTPTLCWMLLAIEAVGLLSAWIARLSTGSRHQTLCHCIFLACLGLVGATAPLSLNLGPSYWLASSVTVALMTLIGTCDFRHARREMMW